jgi:hypothetical protein
MIRSNLLIILFLFAVPAFSQHKDAGLWADCGLKWSPDKRWELGLAPEIRLDENLSRLSRLFIDAQAQYKLTKEIFVTAVYRQGIANRGEYYEMRQRILTGIGLRQKFGELTCTFTSRWQASLSGLGAESDVDFVTTWRNRLQVKYGGLKKTDLSGSFELFNNSSVYGALQLQSWRGVLSLERKLDKRTSVSLGYLVQKSLQDSPQELDFVVLASFSKELKFGRKKEKEEIPSDPAER